MGKREDNLTPFTSEQSREKAVENGAKGGIASGEAKRRKRDIRLAMEALLEKKYKTSMGELSGAEAISLKQMEKALKGDPKAFELVRDSAGQKPIEKVVVAEVEQAVIDDVENSILGDDNTSTDN
jgi:hypothetical protein